MSHNRRPPLRNRNSFAHNTHRSILLEDYRENRYENLQLGDIVSHIVEFSMDRDGSKLIQRKLDDATDHRKEATFRELRPHLICLMKDTFANFVVQKMFDIGSDGHRHELIELVRNNFMDLSLNKYGCRVVQKVIEKSTMQSHHYLLHPCAQADNILRLAKDANANHVIQKCFRCVHPTIQNFLFGHINGQVPELCFNLYGCRVIQCILECGTVTHRSAIFNSLMMDPMPLIQDRYGNYVIQYALQHCAPPDQYRLAVSILNDVFWLSQQKYASNVVEKCLNKISPQMQQETMGFLCSQRSDDLKKFCVDTYANYVIQKLIESATDRQLEEFRLKLRPYYYEITRHVCGRKIIDKLRERGYAM